MTATPFDADEPPLPRSPGKESRVGVVNGFVVKRYSEHFERELVKARAMSHIAGQGGFIVPDVIVADAGARTITYRWQRDLTSLRDLYVDYLRHHDRGESCPEMVHRSGRVLGELHRGLPDMGATLWVPPAAFARAARRDMGPGWQSILAETPHAGLHCDYGFGNVQVARALQPEIVVLDPSPNGYLTHDPLTSGPVYVDLATMVGCLWGLVPVRVALGLDRSRVAPLVAAFVAGYEVTTGWPVDRRILAGTTRAVIHAYLTTRLGSEWLGRVATWVLARGNTAPSGESQPLPRGPG